MATTFKTFLNQDITTNKTLLHEAIPITGAILSGTYDMGSVQAAAFDCKPTEYNIKNYTHGMFQSVYDYPYLSSSANHILDISVGYSTGSALSGNVGQSSAGTNYVQQEKKIAMYNQMAQVLMGHDTTGKIRRFDNDGLVVDSVEDATNKMDEVVFLNFSRLLVKDEIKKGSFTIQFGTEQDIDSANMKKATGTAHILTIKDTNAQNDFRINSPAGEFGILSASHTAKAGHQSLNHKKAGVEHPDPGKVGLIFYQAGVVVLTASIFNGKTDTAALQGAGKGGGILNQALSMSIGGQHGKGVGVKGQTDANINQMLTGSKIDNIANNVRRRLYQVNFNNTTELNSTIYFCRANHNEFNYSSNPTYLADSKIRVKNVPTDMPISYVTSVGLYSPDNELMAVAKLSEPLRKDPTNELTLRVRLDY